MHTQAVFVMVSDRSGRYAHLTAAAMDCLRFTEPGVHITLVCDEPTAAVAGMHYPQVLDRADSLKVVATRETGPAASRELKMRLRQIITGTFIYIDSDAFVIDRLPNPQSQHADFSIAIDAGIDLSKLRSTHDHLGWPIPATYYNSGVFIARDTPAVHQLFFDWQHYWKAFRSLGSFSDQPALNHAIALANTAARPAAPLKIATLHSRYNAVFHSEPRLTRNAAVLHFFASDQSLSRQTILDDLIEEVARRGKLSIASIQHLRSTRYPWKDPYSFKGNLYTGRYLRAAAFAPLCLWRRLTSFQTGRVSHRLRDVALRNPPN